MPLLYVIPSILFVLGIGLLVWGSYKAFRWAFVTVAPQQTTLLRRFVGSIFGLFLLAPLAYPSFRDTYRNHLCETEGGVKSNFSLANWKLVHAEELSAIDPVDYAKRRIQVAPDTWRELLNTRFAVDLRNRKRALGVSEQTFSLVDVSSGRVLSTFTKFHTGGRGRMLPVPSLGRPEAQSCFAGMAQFFELRRNLQQVATK